MCNIQKYTFQKGYNIKGIDMTFIEMYVNSYLSDYCIHAVFKELFFIPIKRYILKTYTTCVLFLMIYVRLQFLANGDMNNLSSPYPEDKIRFSHNLLAVVCHFVHRSVPCSVCKLLHA